MSNDFQIKQNNSVEERNIYIITNTKYRIREHAKIKPGANNVIYERIKVIPNVNIDKYTSDSMIKLTVPTALNRWRGQLGTEGWKPRRVQTGPKPRYRWHGKDTKKPPPVRFNLLCVARVAYFTRSPPFRHMANA